MKDDEIKILIRYRLEQADESLDDAKALIDSRRTPRSVINRFYYAMFYAALGLLQTIDQAPSKHTGVVSLFNREFVSKGLLPRQQGKDFHAAFDLRQITDYKIGLKIDQDMAM